MWTHIGAHPPRGARCTLSQNGALQAIIKKMIYCLGEEQSHSEFGQRTAPESQIVEADTLGGDFTFQCSVDLRHGARFYPNRCAEGSLNHSICLLGSVLQPCFSNKGCFLRLYPRQLF